MKPNIVFLYGPILSTKSRADSANTILQDILLPHPLGSGLKYAQRVR